MKITLLFVALGVFLGPLVSQAPHDPAPAVIVGPDDLLSECDKHRNVLPVKEVVPVLHETILKRFEDEKEFGNGRLMRFDPHYGPTYQYVAENETEWDVLCAIRRNYTHAAVMLAGRGLLGYRGERPDSRRADLGNAATLSEAVYLYRDVSNTDLPDRDVLRAIALKVMHDGEVKSQDGGWLIEARVIRATGQACVACHNGDVKEIGPTPILFPDAPRLAQGDALGAVVYVLKARDPLARDR